MKHYVDSCTACIMKDAKIEMLRQELGVYKEKLRLYETKNQKNIQVSVDYCKEIASTKK